jgi:hypothetical protein
VGYRFESCWDHQCFQSDSGMFSSIDVVATGILGSDETIFLVRRKRPEANDRYENSHLT